VCSAVQVFSILRILDLKFKLKLHTGGIGQTTAHGCSGRGARIFRYPKLPSILIASSHFPLTQFHEHKLTHNRGPSVSVYLIIIIIGYVVK
jgi:hypothetical protein